MKDRTQELAHDGIGALIMRYSVPATVGMVVNSLYNIVDTIFIGQGAGRDALAAIAVCFPIQIIILGVAQLVGLGAASIISRRLGARDPETATKVAGTAFTTVILLSLILTTVSLLFLDPILRLFGATEQILPYGRDYLSVIMGGSVFSAFAMCASAIVRSEGNIKVAMYSMILGAVANAVMDPFFIFDFGLGMGIKGAAVSTVLASSFSCIFLIVYFTRGRTLLKVKRTDLRPNVAYWPEIFSVGLSSFARTIAGSLLAIVVNHAIIVYGTELHLAIFAIANRMTIFMLMPLFGLVHGLQPIIGFNYGARNFLRVKEALNTGIRISIYYCSACFAVVMLFTYYVLRMFSSDAALLEEGVPVMRIMMMLLPLIGIQVIGASLFQAIGKAWIALFLSMSRQILFLVPLVLLLPQIFNLAGIWYAIPLADFSSLLITILWVLRERRIFDRQAEIEAASGT